MISDQELRSVISKVISEMNNQVSSSENKSCVNNNGKKVNLNNTSIDLESIPDIGLIELKEQILLDNPERPEELKRIRRSTPARIAIGRAGNRYKTASMLRFRLDHAAAQDSVFKDVSEDLIKKMNLETVQTKCEERNEYITRPDLGRQFNDEELKKIERIVEKDAQILIYLADGLSSAAIEANAELILPILLDGLKAKGIKVATPFFVKYGRVGTMDAIGEVVNAEVICVLIGERPGLVTAESMSAYFAYKPKIGMPESRRTLISNIHKGGTPALEAGSHLVDVLSKALKNKASGLDLK